MFAGHAGALATVRTMRTIRFGVLLSLWVASAPLVVRAKRIPVPLNDYTRLGQAFTAAYSFEAVSVTVPSWLDAEGGLTLVLWDSPARTTRLASQVFADIPDNAPVRLLLEKPLPPGTYYWEVGQRTGTTRVGLYADVLAEETPECIYLDGVADRTKRFLFSVTGTVFRYVDVSSMLAALDAAKSRAEREDACRQLAVQGTPACVSALARLLGDETMAHMARYALEPMPFPAVDAALREAVQTLRGPRLIGVINSIGVRRDGKAVALLATRLRDADTEVARAAAVALGQIGTVPASEALETIPAGLDGAVLPAVQEGLLVCAQRLVDAGDRARSAAICEGLLARAVSPAVRKAALRGVAAARGTEGVPVLARQVSSDDPVSVAAALWVIQHDLPGADVTRALAEALPKLPPGAQILLVRALGSRGDASALPLFAGLLDSGEVKLRMAALQNLPRLGATGAAPLLAQAVRDQDAGVAAAAEVELGRLLGGGADAEVATLLRSERKAHRLAGIRLSAKRLLREARPALTTAARDADGDVRTAALKALKDLATPEDVAVLIEVLTGAADAGTAQAAEKALEAACGRAKDPTACVEALKARLAKATPELRVSCLRLLAGIGDRWSRSDVLKAADDDDPAVRAAAYRLLGVWTAPEAATDLLRLAADSPDPAGKLLCLRACIRLAGAKGRPVGERVALCRQAAALVERDDEKKLLLGALGGLPDPEALTLAAAFLDDPAVPAECGTAVLAIAESLAGTPRAAETIPVLRRLVGRLPDAESGRKAQALIARIEGK